MSTGTMTSKGQLTLRLEFGLDAVPRAEIIRIVGLILSAGTLVVEHADAAERALRHSQGDLADGLIHEIGRSAGCTGTVTFDRKFARAEGAASV